MTVPDWFPVLMAHPLLSAGLFLLGVLVVSALRPVLRRTRVGSRLDSS